MGKFIEKNKIDLVIVGPEKPLVDGVVDFLANMGVKVFGPNKVSSQLEGSKIFTKKSVKNIIFLLQNLMCLILLKMPTNIFTKLTNL